MSYQKTTVEIDVQALAQAQDTLQTHGIKETVNAALREVNRKAALKEAAAYVLSGRMRTPDDDAGPPGVSRGPNEVRAAATPSGLLDLDRREALAGELPASLAG